MANITIKELLASDKVSELVDKINFNFDQLLLNGGGPSGPIGPEGEIGPIGPRGSNWFSAIDIYTTSTSPSWTGSEERVNDDTAAGYPQYKGDPNKYLPIGNGTFPENTYQIGNTFKQLRDGDLYVQEGDDSVNSYSSQDGDIWQYDTSASSWLFTGVNIKGSIGATGSPALPEWTREPDGVEDLLYPEQDAGQEIARVGIGIDPTNAVNEISQQSVSTFMGIGGPLIALMERSLHSPSNLIDAPEITVTSGGDLIIEGSDIGSSKQIQIQAQGANVLLDTAGGPKYTLDYTSNKHEFTGGPLEVIANVTDTHLIKSLSGTQLEIKTQDTFNDVAISSNEHIVLQKNYPKNVGIGPLSVAPANTLSVSGNASIGTSYSSTVAPTNSLIVEGKVGIGNSSPTEALTIGTSSSVEKIKFNVASFCSSEIQSVPSGLQLTHFQSNPVSISNIDLNPKGTALQKSYVKLFNSTTASQSTNFEIYDNSSSPSNPEHLLGASTGLIFSNYLAKSASSRLGIGTTTPTKKLDVDGELRVRALPTGATSDNVVTTDASGEIRQKTDVQVVKDSGEGVPTGTIVMWGGTEASIPTGWLLCNGQGAQGALFVQLFNQGSPFGTVAGFLTPRVPDLRDRFVVGARFDVGGAGNNTSNYNVGQSGGSNTVILQESEMPSHTHGPGTLTTDTDGNHNHKNGYSMNVMVEGGNVPKQDTYGTDGSSEIGRTNSAIITDAGNHSHSVNGGTTSVTGGDAAHENRPPYFALCFIIKYT